MLKTHEKFQSASTARRRILIVDDEAINRDILGMTLEDDYDILYARDGQEALGVIREQGSRLSLILLDLMMPVMTGMELLKILREDPALRQIPVLVLTAARDLYTFAPIGEKDAVLPVCSGDMLFNAFDEYLGFLR